MSRYAADDFDTIEKNAHRIAGRCYRHMPGKECKDCWCIGAGENGANLPCPPQPDAVQANYATDVNICGFNEAYGCGPELAQWIPEKTQEFQRHVERLLVATAKICSPSRWEFNIHQDIVCNQPEE